MDNISSKLSVNIDLTIANSNDMDKVCDELKRIVFDGETAKVSIIEARIIVLQPKISI